MSPKNSKIQWSEIDKLRFYGIGTGMYTAITIALHPITVLKIRQQIVPGENIYEGYLNQNRLARMRGFYRGMGIILVLAIPARGVYIGTLESSREIISNALSSQPSLLNERNQRISNPSPLIASISGGLAGGLASMASQTIVVPMDVISQRQMVMNDATHTQRGGALAIMSKIIKSDGYRGLFRGFGLSVFTSLPVGTLWWGAYSGCQILLQQTDFFRLKQHHELEKEVVIIRGVIQQVICGLSAAIITATATQPLDIIKTMIQVGSTDSTRLAPSDATMTHSQRQTYSNVAKKLYRSSGFRGFYRGVGPRIASMGLWGTVLSSAYEYLRHISRKDYQFDFNLKMASSS